MHVRKLTLGEHNTHFQNLFTAQAECSFEFEGKANARTLHLGECGFVGPLGAVALEARAPRQPIRLRSEAPRMARPCWRSAAKRGIRDATFYNLWKKYAGLMPSQTKRLRQLEEENAKLKRIFADLSLDKAMLQDVLSKSFEAL